MADAQYEGHWSRLNCQACGEVFEVEGDVSNGEQVTCDACGTELLVVGR
jgi:predicted nucleic acid-binding Zn ribbon protein